MLFLLISQVGPNFSLAPHRLTEDVPRTSELSRGDRIQARQLDLGKALSSFFVLGSRVVQATIHSLFRG